MFCVLLVLLIAAPDERRRSFFFRFQEAERPKGRPPRIAMDPLCLKGATLCLFSHINLVLSGFAHHKSDLGLSTLVGCIGVWKAKLHPCTSGTRLKGENPETDPQRNCLD